MLLTVLVFALVGAAAQMVDGTLGMGFGVTSATLLTLLGYSAVAASAGTHAAKMGTTFVSGISHWREGNVDFRVHGGHRGARGDRRLHRSSDPHHGGIQHRSAVDGLHPVPPGPGDHRALRLRPEPVPGDQRAHATPLAGRAGRWIRGCHGRWRLGAGGDAVAAHPHPARAASRGRDGQCRRVLRGGGRLGRVPVRCRGLRDALAAGARASSSVVRSSRRSPPAWPGVRPRRSWACASAAWCWSATRR